MRTRIALAAAVAVIVFFVTPAVLVSLFSSDPASAGSIRHESVDLQRTAEPGPRVMSYDQARQAAALATFANVVTLTQEENYLKEVAFLQTLQKQSFYEAILRNLPPTAPAAPVTRPAPVAPAASAAPTTAGGSDATSTNTPDWACIRAHESGGNYSEGGGGAYQFEFATWNALTGLSSPAQVSPPSVQDAAALKLFNERGWAPWTTRSVCGL